MNMRMGCLEILSKPPLYVRDRAGRFGSYDGSLPDKLLRDARRLKQRARWVLLIDEKGEVRDFIGNDDYVANVIAVLGPVTSHGMKLSEALLLEIGISHGRPYLPTESHRKGGRAQRERMKGRSKAADITLTQLQTVWPMILSIIEESVIQARSTWKNKDGWFVNTKAGCKCFERGICFSVSNTDHILHEAFLLRDVDVRSYLRKNARSIWYFLRRYKYVYYPEKQLKSLVGVKKVVELWQNMSDSPRWSRRYAHRVIGALPSATRTLFRHIADVFHLDIGEELEKSPVHEQARSLAFPKHLRIRHKRDGKVRSKNSMFEIFFDADYRKYMKI